MQRIGYTRYYIQGGDWGAIIVGHMATLFPEHVIGMHSNMCQVMSPLSNLKTFIGAFFPSLVVSKEHRHKMYPLKEKFMFKLLETGYMHLQATKPDTVGVALQDSPVGLAAYILEKFITWTNPAWKDLDDGGLTKKIYPYQPAGQRDDLLGIQVYNDFDEIVFRNLQVPVTVPAGCAKFSYELNYQPDTILKEKYVQLVHSADYEGGHFAAFENPGVLAEDIYVFVEKAERAIKAESESL
ncbi:hypothetical protein NQ315_001369 [Exocentrus adspersus]|uniref:Epoxide hydrolase n=1 Tax=Exocentrus adspersus TaxID=1586481 RepID=A0AAV8WF72_9CUCU|nr:hypothetical protein NQ315_001369 [Exocentrus adspersus]